MKKCIAHTTIQVPNVAGREFAPGMLVDMDEVLCVVDGREVRLRDHLREDCFVEVVPPAEDIFINDEEK